MCLNHQVVRLASRVVFHPQAATLGLNLSGYEDPLEAETKVVQLLYDIYLHIH
ncbi:MAG: hypothetical protein ACRD22_10390 [Terriglobia bacterium]